MALWTDIINPVEATAILRAEIQLREQQNGSLSRWLPNVFVPDTHVKFYKGDHGLVDEAYYRAYDAAPEIIGAALMQSAVVELPAMSNNQPIDERTQLAIRRLPDDQVWKSIAAALRRAAWSIADRNEKTRGQVVHLGKAAATQHNFLLNDDFGRDPALSYTLAKLWSDMSADGLMDIQNALELYALKNSGAMPGTILMSQQAYAAFSRLAQFRTVLTGGATRQPMAGEVDGIIAGAGFPKVEIYRRQTKSGLVLPKEYIYFLPEATDPSNPDGTSLGATFWGQTMSADLPSFGLLPGEQPGAVAGVYQEDRIPNTVEVMADAITLPVARDANKAMAVKVL